jgi:hypothetical protein
MADTVSHLQLGIWMDKGKHLSLVDDNYRPSSLYWCTDLNNKRLTSWIEESVVPFSNKVGNMYFALFDVFSIGISMFVWNLVRCSSRRSIWSRTPSAVGTNR